MIGYFLTGIIYILNNVAIFFRIDIDHIFLGDIIKYSKELSLRTIIIAPPYFITWQRASLNVVPN